MISRIGFPNSISSSFFARHFKRVRGEAELGQHGGVDVGDVVAVLGGVEADFVGRSVSEAPFQAAAAEPAGEAVGVMVAAFRAFFAGSA